MHPRSEPIAGLIRSQGGGELGDTPEHGGERPDVHRVLRAAHQWAVWEARISVGPAKAYRPKIEGAATGCR